MQLYSAVGILLAFLSFGVGRRLRTAHRSRAAARAARFLGPASVAAIAAGWTLDAPAAVAVGWGLAWWAVGAAWAAVVRVQPVRQGREAWRAPVRWTGVAAAVTAGAVYMGAWDWLGSVWDEVLWGCLGVGSAASAGAVVLARRAPTVVREGRPAPSLRFPCPRCGVRVDWGAGGFPCPDCGLFVHADWGAEAGPAGPALEGAPLTVACPGCGERAARPPGTSACGACGLPLRLSWNVHRGSSG